MSSSISYEDAGVSVNRGNKFVQEIKDCVLATKKPDSINNLGGFCSFQEIPIGYDDPVLVTSTDGVGTKMDLAREHNALETIGIDLVAMVVNDIITSGARPRGFLDYYATGKLNIDEGKQIISGISWGCQLAKMELLGGETAEMPGIYPPGKFDLAGFGMGIVERHKIITGENISPGDVLIGLESTGPHSNGYSLIREIIRERNVNVYEELPCGTPAINSILAPTLIYVRAIEVLLDGLVVHGIANITGGGLLENVPRILPEGTCAVINAGSWDIPPVFTFLQRHGNINHEEMHTAFNNGIGMVVCVEDQYADTAIAILDKAGYKAHNIGVVIPVRNDGQRIIVA